jgi:hypothetical protein
MTQTLLLPKPVLLVLVALGGRYLWHSIRYWFRIPAAGVTNV